MSMEQRIRHLLEAARRAEAEGDLRTAGILRRMAKEALPVEAASRPWLEPAQRRVG
jgi:hypothetical protein